MSVSIDESIGIFTSHRIQIDDAVLTSTSENRRRTTRRCRSKERRHFVVNMEAHPWEQATVSRANIKADVLINSWCTAVRYYHRDDRYDDNEVDLRPSNRLPLINSTIIGRRCP